VLIQRMRTDRGARLVRHRLKGTSKGKEDGFLSGISSIFALLVVAVAYSGFPV
jgi:hypothetical protein